jgi:hypothetical protein
MTDERGSPLDEIEITDEMVKAGIQALCQYNWEIETEDEAAKRIYRAMWKAQRSQRRESR